MCDQRLAGLDHGFAGLDDGFGCLDQREGSIVQSIGVEPSLYQLNFRAQMTADSASETFTFYFAKPSNQLRVWKQSRKKWEPTIPDRLQIFLAKIVKSTSCPQGPSIPKMQKICVDDHRCWLNSSEIS